MSNGYILFHMSQTKFMHKLNLFFFTFFCTNLRTCTTGSYAMISKSCYLVKDGWYHHPELAYFEYRTYWSDEISCSYIMFIINNHVM